MTSSSATIYNITMPRKPIYPWTLWTNGDTHTARFGEDFSCAPQSFIAYLHNKARNTFDPTYNPPDTPKHLRRPMSVMTMTHMRAGGHIDVEFRFSTLLTDEEEALMNEGLA